MLILEVFSSNLHNFCRSFKVSNPVHFDRDVWLALNNFISFWAESNFNYITEVIKKNNQLGTKSFEIFRHKRI